MLNLRYNSEPSWHPLQLQNTISPRPPSINASPFSFFVWK
ncbi:hypothetical protein TorRG33x02_346230 [Trema orientale]|uniref:Uncharacterized protein n=1 Tax=Trema orientale TaxID=63057 RepID=A0A2P5AN02_TREOI|nr:hypothetical protein TorRG33x02_346230 [Trema orientale]